MMMFNDLKVIKNFPLNALTTFKIGGPAKYFIEVNAMEELVQALRTAAGHRIPVFILGGGSNILVSDYGFEGIVLKLNTRGMAIIEEDENDITLHIASGEIWDDVVAKAVDSGWWGIENLSLIPGSMGAFAVQNVGAYGQEAGDVVQRVEAWDRETEKVTSLTNEACRFSYRKSIFNSKAKGRYVILNTTIQLKRNGKPNMLHQGVRDYFKEKSPTLKEMRKAIIEIRRSKLPDPRYIGNAGSFFNNLIITEKEFDQLERNAVLNLNSDALQKLRRFKNRFSTPEGIKIPTAFLIDACGLKGVKVGGASLYQKHSLIVVNADGKATAHDIMCLAKKIRQIVYRKTGLKLPQEPECIGFRKEDLDNYFSLES